ncbi:signal recognition particle-docking protein FtsY [Corynebacterium otitidis]
MLDAVSPTVVIVGGIILAVVIIALIAIVVIGRRRGERKKISFDKPEEKKELTREEKSGNYQAAGGFNFAAGGGVATPQPAEPAGAKEPAAPQPAAQEPPRPADETPAGGEPADPEASEPDEPHEKGEAAPAGEKQGEDTPATDEPEKAPSGEEAGLEAASDLGPADAPERDLDESDSAHARPARAAGEVAAETAEPEATNEGAPGAAEENGDAAEAPAAEADAAQTSGLEAAEEIADDAARGAEDDAPAAGEPAAGKDDAGTDTPAPAPAAADEDGGGAAPAPEPGPVDDAAEEKAARAEAEEAAAAAAAAAAASSEAREATPAPKEAEQPDERPEAAAAAPAPEEREEIAPAAGRLGRLRGRLSRSRGALGQGVLGILSAGDLDDDAWEEIEDTLIMADLGSTTTMTVVDELREKIATQGVSSEEEARGLLREVLVKALKPEMDRSIKAMPYDGKPAVVLMVGVNGTGKTTTTGKLARVLVAQGHDVVLGAADTFRAAAADQLETWGRRVGATTVRGKEGADPASVAFDAVQQGVESGADVVVVDTAGRLHTSVGLMDQLGKVKRVVEKKAAVDEVLLVLDATVGQNGLMQARTFRDVVDISGVVLTKLDGTAKGGIVFQVQEELGVPVKMVGLGEGADDLAPFEVESFVDALLGTSQG